MEFSNAALSYLRTHLLPEEYSPEEFFQAIAHEAAIRDQKIEPGTEKKEIQDRFFELFEKKLFFPSIEWLRFFGKPGKGRTIDTPLDCLGGNNMPRTSLRDSEILRHLEGTQPYRVDVPPAFVHGLERQVPWQIHYRNEPHAAGEVPSQSLWEALKHQIKTQGFPVFHFPEAIRPGDQYENPPGPMVRGTLNLAKMVREHQGELAIDWNLIVETVVDVVRFLDALVEIAEEQRQDGYMREVRRIGIGMMGFAELLLMLGIPYTSQNAVQLASRIAHFVRTSMHEASAALTQYRPVVVGAQVHVRGFAESVRNLSRLFVLPEQELAILADTSPGIDPLPALAGRWIGLTDAPTNFTINKSLVNQLEERGWLKEKVMDELMDTGELSHESGLPADFLDLYATQRNVEANFIEEMASAMQQLSDELIVTRIWMAQDAPDDFLNRRLIHAVYRKLRTMWIMPEGAMNGVFYQAGSSLT